MKTIEQIAEEAAKRYARVAMPVGLNEEQQSHFVIHATQFIADAIKEWEAQFPKRAMFRDFAVATADRTAKEQK